MKQIPLTQGKFAIVDDEDFKELSKFNWYVDKGSCTFYAARYSSQTLNHKRGLVRMHCIIMGAARGEEVDHINHNGLDNRRSNLRICSHAENSWNQRPRDDCSSQFKGVYWYKRDNKWMARIEVKKKRVFLGTFSNEKEAAKVYDAAAVKHFGEFAYTNFRKDK